MLARGQAIRRITITETADGSYEMSLQVGSLGSESVLMTSRGRPRRWVSLNTLLEHIRDECGSVGDVRVRLCAARPDRAGSAF